MDLMLSIVLVLLVEKSDSVENYLTGLFFAKVFSYYETGVGEVVKDFCSTVVMYKCVTD
jgi:hypothetical protein